MGPAGIASDPAKTNTAVVSVDIAVAVAGIVAKAEVDLLDVDTQLPGALTHHMKSKPL